MLALAAFGAAIGLGDREIHVFERAAAKEIKGKLQGPDAQVRVQVVPDPIGVLWGALDSATIEARDFSVDGLPLFTEPDRSKAGRCGKLVIDLKEFELRGLKVASLHSEIPACRYDRSLAWKSKTFRLSKSGTGRGTVRIRESDLAAFILHKYHEIKEVKVKVYNGVVWVEGYGEFLIVKSNFVVIADLKALGTKLELSDAKVYFDWRKADALATKTLLQTLNPVVDFDKDLGLYDAVTVDRIKLEGGILEASGVTKIPTKPLTAAIFDTSKASRTPPVRPSTGSSSLLPWFLVRS
ncbi:MAG: hypothetical protein JSS66_13090 [Armatimonadetes bacterium]|nr:hypothetical protein [Armatimonadota bacterium]